MFAFQEYSEMHMIAVNFEYNTIVIIGRSIFTHKIGWKFSFRRLFHGASSFWRLFNGKFPKFSLEPQEGSHTLTFPAALDAPNGPWKDFRPFLLNFHIS